MTQIELIRKALDALTDDVPSSARLRELAICLQIDCGWRGWDENVVAIADAIDTAVKALTEASKIETRGLITHSTNPDVAVDVCWYQGPCQAMADCPRRGPDCLSPMTMLQVCDEFRRLQAENDKIKQILRELRPIMIRAVRAFMDTDDLDADDHPMIQTIDAVL